MNEEQKKAALVRIDELMQIDEFKDSLSNVANPQELVDLFRNNGVEVPMDVAEELFVPSTYKTGELNDEELDNVSGGGKLLSLVGGAIGNGLYYGAGYLGGRLAGWSKKESKEYASKCGKFGTTFGSILGYVIPSP